MKRTRCYFPGSSLPEALILAVMVHLNGLLTAGAGQINGTVGSNHNVDRLGAGTGVYGLWAPRQIEFGLRLTF